MAFEQTKYDEGKFDSKSEVLWLTQNFYENISSLIYLITPIWIKSRFSENIHAKVYISSYKELSAEWFELISSNAFSESSETKICYIDITIPAGKELIIDADQYNVFLDGENAIYAQRGDWIDELNRDTISIAITSALGSDNINASIFYKERYL